MPGPPPKAPGQRRRRNAVAGARTLLPVLPDGKQLEKPTLGERPDGVDWHPAAVAMWNAVWESPMAPEYDASDVHGLMRLLDLVHLYWAIDPSVKGAIRTKVLLAAEIRLQAQNFGLSPLDRRRLQWEIEKAEQAQDAGARRRAAAPSRPRGEDPRTKF